MNKQQRLAQLSDALPISSKENECGLSSIELFELACLQGEEIKRLRDGLQMIINHGTRWPSGWATYLVKVAKQILANEEG